MDKINITEVRPDWFIASMVMLGGKIYNGFGIDKVKAVEDLIASYKKENENNN
jgi:hypothetical protein